jgi:hypothetical protein
VFDWENNYPENGFVNPPRHDTLAFSPAGMPGGKAPLRLAVQKSRPHAPIALRAVRLLTFAANWVCTLD